MRDYQPAPDLLHDRVILVTGAGDGIGRAAATAFAAHGATVVLLGRTIFKLEAVYDEIEAAGGPKPAIYPMNLEGATNKDFQDLANTLQTEFGRLDGLLHNAATLGALMPLDNYDPELWYKVMQVNLNAPFMLTQACLPLLRQAEDPRVAFMTDHKSRAYWGAYGVSKAGLEAFMHILADETETNTPIRANGFDPGPVHTTLRNRAYPAESKEGMAGTADVITPLLFLLGPDSRDVTGKTFSRDDF
jgi:NAD(P)-dependent dehydrogenase (short-subunit alcohol dehydrogenase family)